MVDGTERSLLSRLLIVEDDRSQLRTLVSIMEREGFEVVGVSSGAEAMQVVVRERFAVVVVDLRLPDIEGTQLLKKILNVDSRIRVIINTAFGAFTSAKEAVNLGAFAYVEKAGNPDELIRHVHAASRWHLDRYARDLETAVAARTTDLQRVNEALRQEMCERERAEDQLLHSQKMEAVGTLAAGVAHDLSNIFTAITGYADEARRRLPADCGDVADALGEINEAANRATGIARSLLTFSRRTTPEKLPLHLGRSVKEAIRLLRPMLPATIELVMEISTTVPDLWIEGDASQIQQVVMNLLLNARDAMPDGGKLRICVMHDSSNRLTSSSAGRHLGSAVISVEDSGIGIPESLKPRIFEPFFTTKPRGFGTGLGLAVVHGIVSGHNGRIEVESNEGRGTKFVVAFPCCEVPIGTTSTDQAEAMRVGNGETILIAEDSRQVLAIIAMSLKSAGYNVIQAADGDEAVAVFKRHREQVRVAVLDVELPKITGPDCLTAMRELEPELPALFITGRVADELNLAKDKPPTRFLQKPFRITSLAHIIAGLLGTPTPGSKAEAEAMSAVRESAQKQPD